MESFSIRRHVSRLASLAIVMHANRYQKCLCPLAIKAGGGTENWGKREEKATRQKPKKQREESAKKREAKGVEPPSAFFFSRTKEITKEATITIGFTFFITRELAEEASITIGFSFSRITKPAG
jgi:hypothetical protein